MTDRTEALKEDVIDAAVRYHKEYGQPSYVVITNIGTLHDAVTALLAACPEYGDKDNG